jgi:hypothetical protein
MNVLDTEFVLRLQKLGDKQSQYNEGGFKGCPHVIVKFSC